MNYSGLILHFLTLHFLYKAFECTIGSVPLCTAVHSWPSPFFWQVPSSGSTSTTLHKVRGAAIKIKRMTVRGAVKIKINPNLFCVSLELQYLCTFKAKRNKEDDNNEKEFC
jgi:hypothetical protein